MDDLQPPALSEFFPSVSRLTRDLKESVATLSVEEARHLVYAYYAMQDARIRAANQNRQLVKAEKSHRAIEWLTTQNNILETQVRILLDYWTDAMPMGVWAKQITGIGPVISAGLLAHIDITKAPTVGHIWRFAGQDPTMKWEKESKRPWNAQLKVLCYKISDSFVKVQNHKSDVYGKLYAERKQLELERNEQGLFADQAKAALTGKKFRKDTIAKQCYEQGKLPPGHIHARACRWTVKLFLSHWWEEAYRQHFHQEPPLPYPIAHLNHAHKI